MRAVLSIALVAAVLLAPLPALAAEMKPLKDYNQLTRDMRRVPSEERDAETKRRASEYLAQWKASGKKATGTNLYAIGQFQQAAEQFKAASETFRAVRTNSELKRKTRDYAATAEGNLLTFPALRAEIGMPAVDKATQDLVGYAEAMTEDNRKKGREKLQGLLAMLHTMAGRAKASRELRLKILAANNKLVGTHVRPIMQSLLSETHKKGAYDALRKEAQATLKTIVDTQAAVVAAAKSKLDKSLRKLNAEKPGALDDDGNLKQTNRKKMTKEERAYGGAKRSHDSATKLAATLPAYGEPFALLGKPAAEWTLEKAYAEDVASLADLKGKVVLLDFWNTWGESCSFPVVRDLLRDYGEKGLAVVGVTASSNVVYASRFDFDEDFKDQATGGKQYAARLATERDPANGQYILEEGPYREREMEALGVFIENHEMKWPVVLIDKNELGAKYAQDTWPHTVILDKQGNIRFLRGGALARNKPVPVAKVKKVIEDLLAE